jgi:hypothetical protein
MIIFEWTDVGWNNDVVSVPLFRKDGLQKNNQVLGHKKSPQFPEGLK